MSDDPYKPPSPEAPVKKRSPIRWHIVGPFILISLVAWLITRQFRW
jgi:hypothetical protein